MTSYVSRDHLERAAADEATLDRALGHARAFLATLPERPVRADASPAELLAAFGGPLPDDPEDPADVVDRLAAAAGPGLVASQSGRFFGWVIGGALPAALAADWLTSVWDQNAGLLAAAPAAVAAENVAAGWLRDLLALPAGSTVGLTTGACMANFTGILSGRQAVLARAGWDVEVDGLQGAPRIRVLAGDQRHVTVDAALRYAGLGAGRTVLVETDDQGRMRADALARALAEGEAGQPTIVCAAAGNVNTGAFDPLAEVCDLAHARGAWVHVDGAFGLWAAAAPSTRHLAAGAERADSWASDAHKWLNTPYDCGIVAVADAEVHTRALGAHAAYFGAEGDLVDPLALVPDFSRRARGFPVWAALASLGRWGVADLVERCCAHARRLAAAVGALPGADVLNDVVLNQVLLRFTDDTTTDAVVRGLVEDGTVFVTGSTWKGRQAMRVSFSNWRTTDEDVDRTVDAVARVLAAISRPEHSPGRA
ncbi:MAG: pyridoxal phosphate-dependent decarboxylase family protein [Actinomycetes bacterium]